MKTSIMPSISFRLGLAGAALGLLLVQAGGCFDPKLEGDGGGFSCTPKPDGGASDGAVFTICGSGLVCRTRGDSGVHLCLPPLSVVTRPDAARGDAPRADLAVDAAAQVDRGSVDAGRRD